jgi:hypothetical protein
VLLHYGPRGPNVMPTGLTANRAVQSSPDGLPAWPKHGMTRALGQPGQISCRVGPCSCWAKSCRPRADPFNPSQNFRNTHNSMSFPISCIWCMSIVTPACHGYTMTSTCHHNSQVVQSEEVTQDGINLPLVTSCTEGNPHTRGLKTEKGLGEGQQCAGGTCIQQRGTEDTCHTLIRGAQKYL